MIRRAALPSFFLFLLIALHFLITLSYNLTHYYELKKSGIDGLLVLQLLHNILHGGGMTTTLHAPYVSQHWFAIHFSPIFYLLAPLYALFLHLEMLLVVHTLMLAIAAWPVFLCARHILVSSWQALLVAIMYLISPYIVNAAIWDFHEIAFAPFCIAFMLYAVLTQNKYLLIFFGFLLLGIKEHYGLALIGFGLLWARHWKEYRFGLSVSVVGIAALLSIIFFIMPHFSPTGAPAMMNAESTVDRFSWLAKPFAANSPIFTIIFAGLFYLTDMLAALAFLPLRAWLWLLPGLADMTINILANSQMMKNIASYHSAALIPVILIAFARSIKQPFHHFPNVNRRDILTVTLLMSLFASYNNAVLPFNPDSNLWEFSTLKLDYSPDDKEALQSVNSIIGADAPLAAQENVLPHLSVRAKMYHYPESIGDAAYIVLNTAFPYKKHYQVLNSPYGVSGEEYFVVTNKLLNDPQWGIVFYEHDWLVLKKGFVSDKALFAAASSALHQTQEHYLALKKR